MPDGQPGPTFPAQELVRGVPGGAPPKGTDARGRIFFEGPAFATAPDGRLAPADSTPVLRYDRTTRSIDTIGYVTLAPGDAVVSSEGAGLARMQVGTKPFPARDDWAGRSDGGVAIVRVRDYHVDVYPASGPRRSGPPVRADRIPVTESDQETWRAERRANTLLQPRRGGAPGRGDPTATDPEFPAFKPPFVPGALARSNGELWVLRSRSATDPVAVYDVFDATGALVSRIAFPASTRVLGFGNGTVYAARTDRDDLHYLQRYRLPAQ
jgi:hypothetical protein